MVAPAMKRSVIDTYRASKKKQDINWFTEWVCRPPAALFVHLVEPTRLTPNQVTFMSLAVCAGACAMMVTVPGHGGLIAAIAVYELSFVLDCADGQLARIRGVTSVVGHLLDFLMDQIKAFLVFGASAIRLWQSSGQELFLVAGIAGLTALAAAIATTSFMRRPELGAAGPTADGQPAELTPRRGVVGGAVTIFERTARAVVHYPQYVWLVALADRLDLYFWAYGTVNVLYLSYLMLTLLGRLGRFAPRPP
jgi:phosphatidylglycerophosphate synthase